MSEALDPKQYAEEEAKLKKRARRRLVGATVLVLAAVVFLPWALQNEPKPVSSDIEVSIPSQDKDGFRPKVVAVPDASSQKPAEKPKAELPLAAAKPEPKEPKPELVPAAKLPEAKPAEAKPQDSKPLDARTAEVKVDKVKEPPRAEAEHKPKAETKPKEAKAEPKVEKPKAEKVEKAEKPVDKADKVEKSDKAERGYIIQVGAFIDAGKAKSTQAQIVAAGYKSYTETVETDRGTVTRVRAGPFASKDKAEAARAQLQLEGLSGKVVPR